MDGFGSGSTNRCSRTWSTVSREGARRVHGVAIEEIDSDALDCRIDEAETTRLRGELAANDDRPRGLGSFEVSRTGQRLFLQPEQLGTSNGARGPAAGTSHLTRQR